MILNLSELDEIIKYYDNIINERTTLVVLLFHWMQREPRVKIATVQKKI